MAVPGTRIIPALLAAACALALAAVPGAIAAWEGGAMRIEHTCTEFDRLPPAWIDSAKTHIKWHFAHTSHGSQLTEGMLLLETGEAFYSIAIQHLDLPEESDALCTMDGQFSTVGVSPDWYWETERGMEETRAVLTAIPELNISMFAWCRQLDYYTEAQTAAYLDSISVLEAEYPHVVFVYCTGNAQMTGSGGYNRWLRNEQIRAYCLANGKVLYDFADLDSWWRDPSTGAWEQATYEYQGYQIPVEHPRFHGDEIAHTTEESCIQKGKAAWWLAAMLSGWYADPTGTEETSLGGLKRRFGAGR